MFALVALVVLVGGGAALFAALKAADDRPLLLTLRPVPLEVDPLEGCVMSKPPTFETTIDGEPAHDHDNAKLYVYGTSKTPPPPLESWRKIQEISLYTTDFPVEGSASSTGGGHTRHKHRYKVGPSQIEELLTTGETVVKGEPPHLGVEGIEIPDPTHSHYLALKCAR